MVGLTKNQIIEVARRWRYSFDAGKKANFLSLRAEIEHVKARDQKVTVKYAEAIYDLFMNGRPHMIAVDAEAYLSALTDADVASAPFPPFDRERVQALANRLPKPRPQAAASSRLSSTTSYSPPATTQGDFSHLPSGHQTLLGAGNLIGNGISIAFFATVVVLVIGAIGSVFSS